MKVFILLLLIIFIGLFSCQQSTQNQIDNLKQALANSYKPGLGEFMSGIQVHHAKLWFAGQAQNWKLADFEINEIKESLSGIEKYCSDRPEIKKLSMIIEPINNLSRAVISKNISQFKSSYAILTSTCNSCHQATNHDYNIIIQPVTPPYSNQDFKPTN
ncbi:MAG: hypothetical protein IT254_02110 [Chitinophagaceae bacterium]|nr:hypothetical protein [Bacteroidota bacterium]MCC6257094.1 hypothetical protein [Chitinophagaceae bacterium]MCW5917723.1 hypothetical protein [Ferruginibacter sp.]